ncbi:MAG: inorganic diphosphatase [Candidatus Limnocylindria bacterium]
MVEIPRSSRNKYEWDEELQAIKLDRFLFSSMVYPADNGFVPETRAKDGTRSTRWSAWTRRRFLAVALVRVVALFRMRDEKGLDDKVLCVPCEDPNWDHVERLEDLPQQLRDEIAHFFSTYTEPEGHHVTVDGWFPREEAFAVIEASRDRHRDQRA